MSATYVGYGFDMKDVSNESLLNMLHKYDSGAYQEYVEQTLNELKRNTNHGDCHFASIDPEVLKILVLDVDEYINDMFVSCADFVVEIINGEEGKVAGTDRIVSVHDDFIVFDSLRFAEDEARARHVPNQAAFIQMIKKYISDKTVTFGNIYDGVDWADSCCFMGG